ncbi:MAG: ATP-dependent protease subunit HslV [Candidatus Bipolaricaulota bacterium]
MENVEELTINTEKSNLHATTIIAIHSADMEKTVVASDGQATMENTIIKGKTSKVRRLYNNEVLVGFAGSTADAMTLFDKFEGKLQQHNGKLPRAAVELTKEWRTDKILRKLEALMVTTNRDSLLMISGAGDVLEPDEPVVGIGSGGSYALAAAKGLLEHSNLSIEEIARKSLSIAASIDIYTNEEISLEKLEW